jgi:cyclophilin family peptidyl-prolyl cis-trans isomerase
MLNTQSKSLASTLTMLFACLLLPTISRADEPAEPTLESLQQKWTQLGVQITEKRAAIDAETGDVEKNKDEYRDLIDEAGSLIANIKDAAISELKEAPNSKNATRAIMGILLDAAEKGRDKEVLTTGDILIAQKINPLYFETAAKADRLSIRAKEIFEELLIRQRETEADDLPQVKLKTTQGDIVIELYENQAPNTVGNFISLVEAEYYTDRLFHRVIEGFMAQAAETKSDGSGKDALDYTIKCECYTPETRPHFSHVLSMAKLAAKDTGAGQFFLTFSRTSFLDGQHTVFGRVISGGEVLDKLHRTHLSINDRDEPIPKVEKDTIISAEVIRKRDHEYKPDKAGAEKETASDATETDDEPRPTDPGLAPPENDADE